MPAASPAPGFDPGLALLSPLLILSLLSQVASHLDSVSSLTLHDGRRLCQQEEVLVHPTGGLQTGKSMPNLGYALASFLYMYI